MEVKFERVELVRTSTKIIEQLAGMVHRHELKPGDRLPSETELAQQLGASRPTIREALSGLKALGLIESYSGKGNFVRSESDAPLNWEKVVSEIRSRNGFLDALEARRAIESEVCLLAAERADDDAMRRIRTALALGRLTTSPEQFRQADYEFHLSLAQATANQLFVRFIEESFLNLAAPYWDILNHAEAGASVFAGAGTDAGAGHVFQQFHHDHEDISRAIAGRRPDEAREKMIIHLERVREDFLKSISESVEP